MMDGLTTNGVLVMHPAGDFVQEPAPGVWREISVCGNVFALRETRSAQQRGKLVRKMRGCGGVAELSSSAIGQDAVMWNGKLWKAAVRKTNRFHFAK